MNIVKLLIPTIIFATLLSADPVKIMPLGDSITYGDNYADGDNPRPTGKRHAYRNFLWYKLSDAGYDADFVGSEVAGQDVSPSFDPDNEGHPGWTSYDVVYEVYDWLTINTPDIILLHLGSNDHFSYMGGMEGVLNEINRYQDETGNYIHVIVALIIDKKRSETTIRNFNRNLQNLVNERIHKGELITLVDMYSGAKFVQSDYADNTHPNDSGYNKMASVWFDGIMKPYDMELHTLPLRLVGRENIESVEYSENYIEFVAKVPDNGIVF